MQTDFCLLQLSDMRMLSKNHTKTKYLERRNEVMNLKKVISGLLASVMIFGSVVSGIPTTAAGAQPENTLGTDGQGYHEVTKGKRVMVSAARGTSNGGAEILGVNPINNRYWMGEQLKPNTWDENDNSGYFSDPQWLVVDLGYKQTEFTSIALAYQAKAWPTKGKIETGNDTVNWRTVTEINRTSSDAEIGTATYSLSEDNPGTLDRFVRFYFEEVNKKATGLKTVALQSIKIIGKHTGEKVESILATDIHISTDGTENGIISDNKLDIDINQASSIPLHIVKNPLESTRMLIKWNSSNKAVARIEGNSLTGTLIPMSVGRTYITATLAADETIQHTIEVNVVDGKKTNVIAGNTTAVVSESNTNDGDKINLTDSYVDEWHRWLSLGTHTPSDSQPVTMTMDLGRNGTEFDEVRISYFRNEAPSRYVLETSSYEDGPWVEVANIEKESNSYGKTIDVLTENGLTVTNLNGTVQESIKMSEQSILDNHFKRYLRMNFTGPSTSNSNTIGIMEMEIIGTQSDVIPPDPVKVTGFSLNQTSLNLVGQGATQTITPVIEPENATNKKMTWISDNETVAAVDKNGIVTATGKGTATITAKSVSDSRLTSQTASVTVTIPMVTFDANEGRFADNQQTKAVEVNGNLKVTEPEKPKKANATFIGWFTSKTDGEAVTFTDGISDHTYNSATTLYAHWDNENTETPEPEEKKITFNANGGTFANGNETVEVVVDENGRIKKPDNPTRANHAFVAWYDAQTDGKEIKFDSEGLSIEPYEKNTPLYAHWMSIDESTTPNVKMVTFHANGGKFVIQDTNANTTYEREQYDVNIAETETVTKPEDPKRDGYTFAGWFTDITNGTQKFESNNEETFSNSITLYAHWTENSNITLTPKSGYRIRRRPDHRNYRQNHSSWHGSFMGIQQPIFCNDRSK